MLFERYLNAVIYVCDFWNFRFSFWILSGKFSFFVLDFTVFRFGDYNWMKKQGISNIRKKTFFNAQKWVLVIDESIQFGNKKLLLVVAFPEEQVLQERAIGFNDLTPLILQVGESWKSADISDLLMESIETKQISYVISDGGNNLKGAIKKLNVKHINDINHKFSLIIRDVFEENEAFQTYTKALAAMRAKLSLSKQARIVPPKQRIMSRFMNLTPLFQWGIKMIKLMDKKILQEEEEEKLSFLIPLRMFVTETNYILNVLERIQSLLKNKGFNSKNAALALSYFTETDTCNAQVVKQKVSDYFEEMLIQANGKTISCSSDIIESCFGKYKEVVRCNKSVGISDLCLSIAAGMGNCTGESTRSAMENIKINDISNWRKEKIPATLLAQKRDLLKTAG
jgi:hypothetical protein